MREIDLDLDEGADMILMKPAMPYLDVVRAARQRTDVPIGAYQVSGEYSMLQQPLKKAGSTAIARCSSRSSASAARAPTSSSPTSPKTPPSCFEAGNREQGTGNREQGTGNREQKDHSSAKRRDHCHEHAADFFREGFGPLQHLSAPIFQTLGNKELGLNLEI